MGKKIDAQKFMKFIISQEYAKEIGKRLSAGVMDPFPTLEEFTEQNNLYEDE